MIDIVRDMVIKAPYKPVEGDYQVDGLWYCGKCKSPKQARIVINGEVLMPMAKCKCPEAPVYIRPEGVPPEWNFSRDDGQSSASQDVRKFCDRFPSTGLLLYGAVGRGKSFLAGCACNELAKKGVSCVMDTARGFADAAFNDHGYLDRLNRFGLLVLDDLGAERQTEWMQETVLQIVNARWMAHRPMIITTNLSAEQMKNPQTVTEDRLFSRVLGMCVPVLVTGQDRRRIQGRNNLEEWRRNG